MRPLPTTRTYQTATGKVQICIASPHQFFLDHQQLLLDWNVPISYIILVLQQSAVSFRESGDRVALEKDRLRKKLIRFGCNLIFSLQDLGYPSDLFDPRTGYPLLAPQRMICDDNAVAKAILNYEAIGEGECSLLIHPIWQHSVYPSTIVTSAPQDVVKLHVENITDALGWNSNN